MKTLRFVMLVSVVAVLLGIVSPIPVTVGAPPNRLENNRGNARLAALTSCVTTGSRACLDDNRGNAGLAATVSSGLSTLIGPLIRRPFVVSGRVLEHPLIHNLFWDDNWNAHNPGAPTDKAINDFTKRLVASHYFDSASQYGVGSASFNGSDGSNLICVQRTPPSTVSFFAILLWVSCETGLAQSLTPCPPFGTPA